MPRRWIRSLLARPTSRAPRRHTLRVDEVETRELPATLSFSGGTPTYAAGAGVGNSISVSISGSNFVVTDTAETITTAIAGASGSGTNTVNVPTSGVTAVVLGLDDGSDAVAAAGVILTTQNLTVTNTGTLLSVGGPVRTTAGNIGLSGANQVPLAAGAQIGGTATSTGTTPTATYTLANQTTGTITIAADTDGVGGEGFDQAAGWLITNNNTTAAVSVTVTTAGGGSGSATLGTATVGTAVGSRYTVAANGGSIVWSGDAALGRASFSTAYRGTANGGTANTAVVKAYNVVPSAGGGIGTDARPIQTSSPAATATANLTAANGGAFLVDWGSPLIVTGATATGAGNVRVVTANVGGHNLVIYGNVGTGTGNIDLAADDNIVVGPNVTIGGAGFSGTVWMQANRDRGTAGQTFTTDPTSAIVTGSVVNAAGPRTPTTQAVYLDIAGDQRTPSTLAVSNVTTGAGGRLVLNAIPNGIALEAGRVVMSGATNVRRERGSRREPRRTFVTSAGAAGFALNATTIAGQTAATTTVLTTTAGALSIAGPTAAQNGGTLSLTGAAGVVVAAPLGSATTGAITITGALSGAGDITLGTGVLSLTQTTDSSYAGAIGAGTLTLSGASPFSGAATVSAGGLLLNGATLSGTSGLAVADVATCGGVGSVGGPATLSGALAPGGVLGLGGLSFAASGARTVTLDLNGTTDDDQLAVTGAVDLTGAALTVNVGFLPLLGTAFTVLTNDASDPVAGTFAGLAEGATFVVGTRTYTLGYAGGDGNDVVLTVTHVNAGPPVNTVPASASVLEDGFVTFPAVTGTRVGVDNADLGAATVRVTVSAGNGVLSPSTTSGLGFTTGDGTADATMTFTGTLAAINVVRNGLRYDPAANLYGSDMIALTSNDLGATGGAPQTDTDSFPVTVTAVNDVPAFAVSGTLIVAEDAGSQTVGGGATGISAGPANETGQSLTFPATTDNDAPFSALPVINVSGRLMYTPAANANGTATITVRLTDGGGMANGGVDTSLPQTFTIVVTPVNDAPVVSPLAGPVGVPSHGPAAALIASAATVADIDTAVLAGGSLTASITTGGDPGDVLAIAAGGSVTVAGGVVSLGGTPVGSVTGDTGGAPPVVTFDVPGAADAAAVQAVFRRIAFTLTDGDGGTSTSPTTTVTVTAVNDDPSSRRRRGRSRPPRTWRARSPACPSATRTPAPLTSE